LRLSISVLALPAVLKYNLIIRINKKKNDHSSLIKYFPYIVAGIILYIFLKMITFSIRSIQTVENECFKDN